MADQVRERAGKQVVLTNGNRSSLFFLQNQGAPLGAHR